VVLAGTGVIAAFGSASTVGYTGQCYVEYIHV
jgi:hypothetical protein